MAKEAHYRDRSVLIHGKFRSEKWDFQDHILPPITTAVSFRLRSAERGAQGFQQFANPEVDRETTPPIYIYDRLDEPCQGLLEETLAFAEKGECAVSYATGMAAVAAAIGIHVEAGDHVLFHPAIYGCTYSHITNWLGRYNIEGEAVNCADLDALRNAIRPETKVIYFETPCNPTMELIDLAGVAALAKEKGITTIVDNTFASPFAQRPIEHGIDFVVHSLTKHIGGFGASMGGVVVGPRSAETDLLLYRKDFGASLAPDTAWNILNYGIPTLAVRMERQQENALEVAKELEKSSKVKKVWYPGLKSFEQADLARRQMTDIDGDFAPGSMIYFEFAGEPEESYNWAIRFCDHIAENALSITLAVSLGQIRTLIEHPASMTHSAIPPEEQAGAGIQPGGVRLSIGLEDLRDLKADIESAFSAAA